MNLFPCAPCFSLELVLLAVKGQLVPSVELKRRNELMLCASLSTSPYLQFHYQAYGVVVSVPAVVAFLSTLMHNATSTAPFSQPTFYSFTPTVPQCGCDCLLMQLFAFIGVAVVVA
eukprot:m.54344 g.54344  ORF g.54344 m.54344 type:complete len:116 (-) comp7715_c0_seq1:294-641(-)